MGAITRQYNLAKIADISMKDVEYVGTDLGFAAMGGVAHQVIAAANKGSFDLTIGGFKAPIDLFGSIALGLVAHKTNHHLLSNVALGMAGAASSRIMAPHVKKVMGFAGEYEGEASMGWGAEGIDPLVESAKYL